MADAEERLIVCMGQVIYIYRVYGKRLADLAQINDYKASNPGSFVFMLRSRSKNLN